MKSQSRDKQTHLMSSIARHILGESVNLKIKGKSSKVKAIREVICASRELFEELNRSGSSLEKIFELVEKKNSKAHAFTKATGLRWVL
jgi:hypothetical protein